MIRVKYGNNGEMYLFWDHSNKVSPWPVFIISRPIPGTGLEILRGASTATTYISWGLPCGSASKESTCNEGDLGSIPGLGRSRRLGVRLGKAGAKVRTARRSNQSILKKISPGCSLEGPTPVFLPGKFQGQRILARYSPWHRRSVGQDSATK